MSVTDPADLKVFLAIARHRSFRKAATELGQTPSALSHALRALEERLGLRLLNRTTRSVALTEAGEHLHARIAPAFRDIADALDDLNGFRASPSGTLRLNLARPAAAMVLMPLLPGFLAAHPGIRVEAVIDNALIDVVSAGFDAGIRFGERIAADMVAVPIGPSQRSAVVASPGFLARWRRPLVPHDLRDMPCITYRFGSGSTYAWEFEKDGKAVEIEVAGPLALSDQSLMAAAAMDGIGLSYVFEAQVTADIAAGRLVRVLEDWCPSYAGFHLYYPSRRQLPAPLRVFVDFIRRPKS